MKIKALLFDMDGLMVDTERLYYETERQMAEEFETTVETSTLWKMMGKKPIESMTIFQQDLDLPISPEELLTKRDELMVIKMNEDLIPMKGLYEILQTFFKKVRMGVVTGAREDFLDIVIYKLNIRHYFDLLLTSEEITHGKPDPEIYLNAIAKLNLLPTECVVLEDSSNGAKAGKDAGCYTIAIPSEYTMEQDFSFVDFIATDLIEAREHLLELM